MQLRRGSRVPSSRARTLTGRDKGCWLHSHRCALIVKGPRRVSSGTPLGTRVRVHYKGLTAFADGTWPLQPAEGLDALAVAPMWLMRTFPFPCLLLVLRPLVARARGTGAPTAWSAQGHDPRPSRSHPVTKASPVLRCINHDYHPQP